MTSWPGAAYATCREFWCIRQRPSPDPLRAHSWAKVVHDRSAYITKVTLLVRVRSYTPINSTWRMAARTVSASGTRQVRIRLRNAPRPRLRSLRVIVTMQVTSARPKTDRFSDHLLMQDNVLAAPRREPVDLGRPRGVQSAMRSGRQVRFGPTIDPQWFAWGEKLPADCQLTV